MSAKAALEEFIKAAQSGSATLTELRISQLMYDDLVKELGREDIQNVYKIVILVDPTLDETPPPEFLLH